MTETDVRRRESRRTREHPCTEPGRSVKMVHPFLDAGYPKKVREGSFSTDPGGEEPTSSAEAEAAAEKMSKTEQRTAALEKQNAALEQQSAALEKQNVALRTQHQQIVNYAARIRKRVANDSSALSQAGQTAEHSVQPESQSRRKGASSALSRSLLQEGGGLE